MRNCFNFLVTKFPNQKEINTFCQQSGITQQQFFKNVKGYVRDFANSTDKEALEQYRYLYKYEKVIREILNTKEKETRDKLLIKNKKLYSIMRPVYLEKHPEDQLKIRKLDIEYRDLVERSNHLQKKAYQGSIESKQQQQYQTKIECLLKIIQEKLANEDYYIEDEITKARRYIMEIYSSSLREQYHAQVTRFYNTILAKVLEDYLEKTETYSVVDYYYRTNVLPMYLFKRADILNKKIAKRAEELQKESTTNENYYKILKQDLLNRISNNNTYLTKPFVITRKQASGISQYSNNGQTLNCQDLEQIYDFMIEEGLPSYENVYYGLLKECAIKGELVSRKEKKNFVKKLEKRVS